MNPAEMTSTIMLVDDTPANLTLLGGMLKKRGHDVRPFPCGRLAIDAAKNNLPTLILLDINMPEMDGYEVCRQLKADARLRDIPVLFISALSDTLDKVKAFSQGGVDYITKPFQFEEVEARVETHLKLRQYQLHLEQLVEDQVKETSDAQLATIMAMSALAESRDDDTGKHLERMQRYCSMLAHMLKAEPQFAARLDNKYIYNCSHASPLHDIGKVAIPDDVLLKPGKLNFEEFEIIKTHTTRGAETLRAVQRRYPKNDFINIGIEIAQSHHERWDGSGYPEGLAGDAIPLSALIVAVADVYDALCSKRCYKEAYSREQSRDTIESLMGTHLAPDVVYAFLSCEDEFNNIRQQLCEEQ